MITRSFRELSFEIKYSLARVIRGCLGVEESLALENGVFHLLSSWRYVRSCRQQELCFWVNNILHHGQVLFILLLLAILKDPLGFLHHFSTALHQKSNVLYIMWTNCSHDVVLFNNPIYHWENKTEIFKSSSEHGLNCLDNLLLHWINIKYNYSVYHNCHR